MTTSGTATYNQRAVEIVADALAMNGIAEPDERMTALGFTAANRLLKSWQTYGCFLHTLEAVTLNLTADTASYTLDADCIDVNDVRFRRDGDDDDLSPYSEEEYFSLKSKSTSGDPTGYYLDKLLAAPVLYLYYVPENSTSLVSNGGNDYRCIVDHTSAATDEPGVGANTATYWELVGATGAYTAWALSTDYVSDVVKFNKIRKIEDVSLLNQTLDIPSKQLDAFVMGLAYRLSLSKLINTGAARTDLRDEYKELFGVLLADDNERGPMNISPRLDR